MKLPTAQKSIMNTIGNNSYNNTTTSRGLRVAKDKLCGFPIVIFDYIQPRFEERLRIGPR